METKLSRPADAPSKLKENSPRHSCENRNPAGTSAFSPHPSPLLRGEGAKSKRIVLPSPFRRRVGDEVRGFTLVELIVTIAILVILGTIAFLNLGDFSSSARDGRRVSDMANISKAIELSIVTQGSAPMPAGAVPYTGGVVTIQMGTVTNATVPKMSGDFTDPVTKTPYNYSVFGNGNYYQIGIDFENPLASAPSPFGRGLGGGLIETAYADNTAAKYSKLSGNYQFDPSLPSLFFLSGTVNSASGGIFSPDVCFVMNNVSTNTFSSTSTGCVAKKNMSLKAMDSGLVGYWDMETLSGTMLKDLSGNGNDGNGSGGITIGGTGGFFGKGTYFDGLGNDISILNNSYGTGFNWFGTGTGETVSYLFQINPNTILDAANMVVMLRPAEMTSCVGTGYLIFRDNKGNGITISNYPLQLGTFYFYTATYDLNQGNVKLYINGKLVDNRLEGIFQPGGGDGSFHIGALSGGCSGVHFDGVLDDIKIYNRTLSDEEIKQQAKIVGF